MLYEVITQALGWPEETVDSLSHLNVSERAQALCDEQIRNNFV